MSSKCASCDQRNASIYCPESDDVFCYECYGDYESGYESEYESGYECATLEMEFDGLDAAHALLSFDIDPANNAFQYGFYRACINEMEKRIKN